jgi:hypothetical protein
MKIGLWICFHRLSFDSICHGELAMTLGVKGGWRGIVPMSPVVTAYSPAYATHLEKWKCFPPAAR